MILNPFVRCPCGKIHVRTYISAISICTCKRNLYDMLWYGRLIKR